MRTRFLLGFLGAAVTVTLLGAHQQQESCALDVRTTPGSESRYVRLGEGDYRLDAGGGVEATCGTTWVRADSMTYFEGRGQLYLYRNVQYRDELRTLEADSATYFATEERVRAEGNVVLTDLAGRSTLEGPVLDYFLPTEERPVERIFAPSRPHLTFYPDTAGGARSAGQPASSPFEVDADQIHIYGDSLVAGAGRVVANRNDLNAFGDSMHLDLGRDRLWVLGKPRIEAADLVLEGDTITALLEDREIRELLAWPNASAEGREMSLVAPTLRLFVEANDVTRTVAAAGAYATQADTVAAEREPWARSESEDYVLTADSIDILRPGGQLKEVRAFYRAQATSTQPVVPEDTVFGRDWLTGDSIIGYFEAVDSTSATPPEATDSSDDAVSGDAGDGPTETASSSNGGALADGSEQLVELRRLVASGNARALYHLREEEPGVEAEEEPALNYVIGQIVTIWLRGGEVQETEVIGPSTGLYLEPLGPRGEADVVAPPDSAQDADSVEAPAPADTISSSAGGAR